MSGLDPKALHPTIPLARRLTEILADREMGRSAGEEVVAWAEGALAAGLDSPSLRILAGLTIPQNEFEVDRYLNAVATEVGLALPKGTDLLSVRALHIAEDILSGTVTARFGAQRLYEIARATGSVSDLSVWSGLDDALAMADNGTFGTVERVEAEIIAQAQRLMNEVVVADRSR
jgi:hypothetical protein